MKSFTLYSNSQDQTIHLGFVLAKYLKASDIICLYGELGAGKTTFVKGLAKGLGFNQKKVQSPTFVLMNFYNGRIPLFHFDFYRLNNEEDILNMGYEEFFYGQGIAVVEWAERFGSLLPQENLRVQLFHQKEQIRKIKIATKSEKYHSLIHKLKLKYHPQP